MVVNSRRRTPPLEASARSYFGANSARSGKHPGPYFKHLRRRKGETMTSFCVRHREEYERVCRALSRMVKDQKPHVPDKRARSRRTSWQSVATQGRDISGPVAQQTSVGLPVLERQPPARWSLSRSEWAETLGCSGTRPRETMPTVSRETLTGLGVELGPGVVGSKHTGRMAVPATMWTKRCPSRCRSRVAAP